ncbi:9424_t:CDS:1 [Paraglomus brasilianum]|uniref:9424_t:CDS:1 n=1 Tax=Paraglomus brasilianum TaxID=144538 RepID=A0A9N9F9N9_9GLOM|nr:9424_t:CDS:1 [Paraglomus brasilianum]
MAGFNNQSIHENYAYNIPSHHLHRMDSTYTNGHPLNQTIIMDSGYANMDQPIRMDYNDIYPRQDPSKALQQPSGQAFFPPGTGHFDNNNVYAGRNEPTNATPYGYVENHDLTNYNSLPVYYPPPQALVQTPSTSTPPNNAGMTTNPRSHANIIIIMNADVNLERLLSVIQSCERVEQIHM